ncbi:MAG: hypothetical protein ACK4V2_03040 [Pseudomonadota bacterium]|jgi:hypothetical protein
MKNIDQQDMQVKTVHKWQNVLDNSIKSVRFLWRHAIILGMLGMMINVIDLHTANWRNILISLVIAGLVDFFKMKIKIKFSDRYPNTITAQMIQNQKRYNDWSTNPGMAGSPANHLYNLGYPNKYNR